MGTLPRDGASLPAERDHPPVHSVLQVAGCSLCHLVTSSCPQQAVRVEHDPVLRPALAGQRHAGGDQPAHAAGQGGQVNVNVIHSQGSNGHGSLCTGWSVHGTRGQVPE